MIHFVKNPIFLLFLTLLVFYATQLLQKRLKWLLLHPVLITVSVLIGFLIAFNIEYVTYSESVSYIDFWLKPSVVVLGVPLYLQLSNIKKMILPILISQFLGSLTGIVSVCFVAKWLGASDEIIKSLAPKSVTTPIALEVSETLGGIPSLTVVSVIITGILGAMIGYKILTIFNIKNPISKGISVGTASHALGVMASFSISEKYAVYATAGMILNGIFTTLMAPIVVPLVLHLS